MFTNPFYRVYVNISSEFDIHVDKLTSLDMMELIHEVAKANPEGNGKPLYDAATGRVFEKRTKKYIVREVNNFIANMTHAYSAEENMASYASLKQLNHLIRAFSAADKQLSCFSLVYVYVMYKLLVGKATEDYDFTAYVTTLHDLVHDYCQIWPEDEVAGFIVECHEPIMSAFRGNNPHLTAHQLPGIPRKNPKKIEE